MATADAIRCSKLIFVGAHPVCLRHGCIVAHIGEINIADNGKSMTHCIWISSQCMCAVPR